MTGGAGVPLNLQATAANIYIELSLAGGTGRSLAEHVGTRGGDSEGESLFFRKKIRGLGCRPRALCCSGFSFFRFARRRLHKTDVNSYKSKISSSFLQFSVKHCATILFRTVKHNRGH